MTKQLAAMRFRLNPFNLGQQILITQVNALDVSQQLIIRRERREGHWEVGRMVTMSYLFI